jgi:hypothetical protein
MLIAAASPLGAAAGAGAAFLGSGRLTSLPLASYCFLPVEVRKGRIAVRGM